MENLYWHQLGVAKIAMNLVSGKKRIWDEYGNQLDELERNWNATEMEIELSISLGWNWNDLLCRNRNSSDVNLRRNCENLLWESAGWI